VSKPYRFDTYVEEARTDPFRLETPDGSVLEIPAPLAGTLLEMDYTTSPRRVLRLLCGEQYEAVYALVAQHPGSVLNRLLSDLMQHFGADQVPPGAGLGPSI
jgi:predicted NAD/FAD-dependent oxidoreductase